MDTNIEDALARLASAEPHAGLDGLEERVLMVIALQPGSAGAGRMTIAAIGFALALGVVSNVVPTTDARAAPLTALGALTPLAPSTLLGGTR